VILSWLSQSWQEVTYRAGPEWGGLILGKGTAVRVVLNGRIRTGLNSPRPTSVASHR